MKTERAAEVAKEETVEAPRERKAEED